MLEWMSHIFCQNWEFETLKVKFAAIILDINKGILFLHYLKYFLQMKKQYQAPNSQNT